MTTNGKWDVSTRMFVLMLLLLIGVLGFWTMRGMEILNSLGGNYPREITVEAQGKGYVIPDVAVINLGVTTQGKTSEETVTENTKKINEIMKVIKDLGVEDKDIKTVGYYLNPRYEWTEQKGSFQNGYELSQTLEVKVRDFDKVGDLISKTATAGANTMGGVNFTADDTEKAKADARKEALAKVEDKAKLIQEQTGLKLGKIVNYYEYDVTDQYGKGGYSMMAAEGGGGVAPSPEIQPGQQEIVLNVSLSYKIK